MAVHGRLSAVRRPGNVYKQISRTMTKFGESRASIFLCCCSRPNLHPDAMAMAMAMANAYAYANALC